MISIPYFKQTIKSNFKFLLLFTFVLCIFLIIMTKVFTPTTLEGVENIVSGSALGNMLGTENTLIGLMSNSFYAIMAIIFPMIYSIIVGNRLIASKVDKGDMAGYLATPTKRIQITITSAIYLVLSLVFMWGVASIVGIVSSSIFQPDALDVKTFLLLNLGAFLYHLAISSICFCASCIFNTSKNSLLLGAGLPIMFFVLSLIIKLSTSLDVLKYFTLNTLFDTANILNGTEYIMQFVIMGIIAIVLYTVGIVWFNKKDLPL